MAKHKGEQLWLNILFSYVGCTSTKIMIITFNYSPTSRLTLFVRNGVDDRDMSVTPSREDSEDR